MYTTDRPHKISNLETKYNFHISPMPINIVNFFCKATHIFQELSTRKRTKSTDVPQLFSRSENHCLHCFQ